MTDVSTFRLHLLRAVYALVAFGMGSMIWPLIITHDGDWALMPGVVKCMLGGLTLLALLGIRYPLKMLPLLFWEMAWKSIWLAVVAFPLWRAGTLDGETAQTAFETGFVLIVFAVVPWRYVIDHYVRAPADRNPAG